jgi:predicted transcriptional regulator
MAKPYKVLREKMTPASRARSNDMAKEMLAELALNDLRRSLDLTQEEVAKILEMKQATVSRLESQGDMYISTLQRFVSALGGELKLVASFANRDVIISQFDN